ncbi:MAG: sn-glycerol-1-phosphate dehydrogenase [Eubacteriales bacterium]|jgi:glycerol-1-phosphate dehydrogenase [NAD(P)+]|nr:sn-glycerol-1-phosphate dehydrogenase [Eubacteriales bacterium]
MDITAITRKLAGCSCGREHTATLKSAEIGHGLTEDTGAILASRRFPRNIIIVADKNTLSASEGILPSLDRTGFDYTIKLYDDLRTADIAQVNEVILAARDREGILSVGTGSLNDICRYAAFLSGRRFAIFATAPSMDGFASHSAPITDGGFKTTYPAVEPDVLIADTAVLAASPAQLKAAGFGDMAAKYIALADWRVSALLTGEYYCENIANLTREALRRITALADRVTGNDEETAGAIMEALVFTGVAMKLAGCVRPASGAEHMISHFWEMKKLEAGELSDFHGKKTGVATMYLSRLYHALADIKSIEAQADRIDFDELGRVFGDNFIDGVIKMNTPPVTDQLTPGILEERWPEVCRIVREEVPPPEGLRELMLKAGAAIKPEDIGISTALAQNGYRYHAYLRHRLTLSRLIPMIKNPGPLPTE